MYQITSSAGFVTSLLPRQKRIKTFPVVYFLTYKELKNTHLELRTHCFLQKTFILVQLKQYGSQSV
jgi:hypothetical protein